MKTFDPEDFTGIGVALPTPFTKENEVDYEALRYLINLLVAGGVDFLVPAGTTGEAPTLSHAEQEEVIAFTLSAAAGRLSVLPGTGSNSTQEAVALMAMAKKMGLPAGLVVTPYYVKPTAQGYIGHFRAIREVGLPIMLYDIPGRTGKMVPLEVILKLALEGTIFGLKWASGDFAQLMDLRRSLPEDFIILSGDDNLTLPAMALGAQGVISVAANLVPGKMKAFYDTVADGDFAMARRLHYSLLPLFKALFLETNPAPLKEALAITYPEIFLPDLRLPLARMEEANLALLRDVLCSLRVGHKR